MNKPTERLYNGIIKENPHLCADIGYVSHTGGYHISH